jgi:hypothetical protein
MGVGIAMGFAKMLGDCKNCGYSFLLLPVSECSAEQVRQSAGREWLEIECPSCKTRQNVPVASK